MASYGPPPNAPPEGFGRSTPAPYYPAQMPPGPPRISYGPSAVPTSYGYPTPPVTSATQSVPYFPPPPNQPSPVSSHQSAPLPSANYQYGPAPAQSANYVSYSTPPAPVQRYHAVGATSQHHVSSTFPLQDPAQNSVLGQQSTQYIPAQGTQYANSSSVPYNIATSQYAQPQKSYPGNYDASQQASPLPMPQFEGASTVPRKPVPSTGQNPSQAMSYEHHHAQISYSSQAGPQPQQQVQSLASINQPYQYPASTQLPHASSHTYSTYSSSTTQASNVYNSQPTHLFPQQPNQVPQLVNPSTPSPATSHASHAQSQISHNVSNTTPTYYAPPPGPPPQRPVPVPVNLTAPPQPHYFHGQITSTSNNDAVTTWAPDPYHSTPAGRTPAGQAPQQHIPLPATVQAPAPSAVSPHVYNVQSNATGTDNSPAPTPSTTASYLASQPPLSQQPSQVSAPFVPPQPDPGSAYSYHAQKQPVGNSTSQGNGQIAAVYYAPPPGPPPPSSYSRVAPISSTYRAAAPAAQTCQVPKPAPSANDYDHMQQNLALPISSPDNPRPISNPINAAQPAAYPQQVHEPINSVYNTSNPAPGPNISASPANSPPAGPPLQQPIQPTAPIHTPQSTKLVYESTQVAYLAATGSHQTQAPPDSDFHYPYAQNLQPIAVDQRPQYGNIGVLQTTPSSCDSISHGGTHDNAYSSSLTQLGANPIAQSASTYGSVAISDSTRSEQTTEEESMGSLASKLEAITLQQGQNAPSSLRETADSAARHVQSRNLPSMEATGSGREVMWSCPEARSVTYSVQWYTHDEAPGFAMCTSCYADLVNDTQFSDRFKLEKQAENTAYTCDFWHPRVKNILWPRALESGKLDAFLAYINKRIAVQSCKGGVFNSVEEGIKWYGMADNDIEGFVACEACYEDRVVGDSFESRFTPKEQGADEKVSCDLCIPYIMHAIVRCAKTNDWADFVTCARHRLQVPQCDGTKVAYNSREWLMPRQRIENLYFCERCYLDKVAHTQFADEFEPYVPDTGFDAWMNNLGLQFSCGLSDNSLAMAVALESALYQRKTSVLWDAAQAINENVPCTANGIVRGTWWTLKDGCEGLRVCEACYAGILRTTNTHVFFEPTGRLPEEIVCSFCPSSPRFKQFMAKFAESLDRGIFSCYSEAVKKFAGVPVCPGIKAREKATWWCYPEALACEECYIAFIAATPLADAMPVRNEQDDRPIICQMWSPRMRKLWLEAGAAGPADSPESAAAIQAFRDFGRKRSQVYNATVVQIEVMLQMQQMKQMQALHKGQLSLMYSGMNSISSAAGATDGYQHGNSSLGWYETENGAHGAQLMNEMHAGMSEANSGSDWMTISRLQALWLEVE